MNEMPIAFFADLAWSRDSWREPRRRSRVITFIGLLLSFGLLTFRLDAPLSLIYRAFGWPWLTMYGVATVLIKSFVVLALVILVSRGERCPLASIGIRKPVLADIPIGMGAFLISIGSMYTLQALLPPGFSRAPERAALFARFPMWLLLVSALVNGIFEEVSARGFAVERLREMTHSTVLGASIALALNLLEHLPFWGWRQTIVLAPGLTVFLVLYLWRRSVIPCALGHILADVFPRYAMLSMALIPMHFGHYLPYDWQASNSYTRGDFDRAIQLYTKALASDPRDVYALQWRGLAWQNKKNYAKSLSDLSAAIRIDPADADSYAHRAFVYSAQGDYKSALADLGQAIGLQPDDGGRYEMRARIEASLQDHTSARRDYLAAARLDSTNPVLYWNLGFEDYAIGDFQAAVSAYRWALRLEPDLAEGWDNLAMAYIAAKKCDDAIEALAHAIKIDPTDEQALQLGKQTRQCDSTR